MSSIRQPLALLLLAACLPALADSTLPSAPEVEGAIKRATDAVVPVPQSATAPNLGRVAMEAMLLGRFRSMEVTHVSGCVTDESPAITCIARLDWGLGKVGYIPVPLLRQGKQWEAPDLGELVRTSSRPRTPSPTAVQAQAAARQYARDQLTDGASDAELELIASDLHISAIDDNCEFNPDDGSVACQADFRIPAAEDTRTMREFSKRSHFYLEGSTWRFGRPMTAQ